MAELNLTVLETVGRAFMALNPDGWLAVWLANVFPWWLGGLVLGALLSQLWRRRLSAEQFGFITVASALAWLLSELVKQLYLSPRPFLVLLDRSFLITDGGLDSFPSGHASFFFALTLSVAAYYPRWGQVLALGALLIGLARVAVGLHWPGDILGGALLATFTVYGLRLGLSWFRHLPRN